jgi:hypothetical protein
LVENGDANEELRKAVEKALGNAAAKEDQEVIKTGFEEKFSTNYFSG